MLIDSTKYDNDERPRKHSYSKKHNTCTSNSIVLNLGDMHSKIKARLNGGLLHLDVPMRKHG